LETAASGGQSQSAPASASDQSQTPKTDAPSTKTATESSPPVKTETQAAHTQTPDSTVVFGITALPASTDHIAFPSSASAFALTGSKYTYVTAVDYKSADGRVHHFARGTRVDHTRNGVSRRCRVAMIATSARVRKDRKSTTNRNVDASVLVVDDNDIVHAAKLHELEYPNSDTETEDGTDRDKAAKTEADKNTDSAVSEEEMMKLMKCAGEWAKHTHIDGPAKRAQNKQQLQANKHQHDLRERLIDAGADSTTTNTGADSQSNSRGKKGSKGKTGKKGQKGKRGNKGKGKKGKGTKAIKGKKGKKGKTNKNRDKDKATETETVTDSEMDAEAQIHPETDTEGKGCAGAETETESDTDSESDIDTESSSSSDSENKKEHTHKHSHKHSHEHKHEHSHKADSDKPKRKHSSRGREHEHRHKHKHSHKHRKHKRKHRQSHKRSSVSSSRSPSPKRARTSSEQLHLPAMCMATSLPSSPLTGLVLVSPLMPQTSTQAMGSGFALGSGFHSMMPQIRLV
jgi:hypothetical protein